MRRTDTARYDPDLIDQATDAVATELVGPATEQTVSSDNSPYQAIWTPNTAADGSPGPQQFLLDSPAYEIFFGGSAGGGKTAGGIGLAVTQHTNSVFYRRNFKHLKDAMQYSHEVLDNVAHWNGGQHTWTGIPGGRSLEFAHVVNDQALNTYKGQPHDLVIFDEVSDFPEKYYRFLTGWIRSKDPNQKLQILAMGNPPTTAEGEWVVQHWAAWLDQTHPFPAKPGELRWYARIADKEVERPDGLPFEYKGETIRPLSRTFIPARVDDNPFYRNSDYTAVLQSLPEPLRSQLLYGDFGITATDDRWQCIPTKAVQAAQRRWLETDKPAVAQRSLGVDVAHGGADKTVIAALYGVWFDELKKYTGQETPEGIDAFWKIKEAWDGKSKVAIDTIGYGASAADTASQYKVNLMKVNAAVKSVMRDQSGMFEFVNLRAQMYYKFREALMNDRENICLPPDRELLADLCAPRFVISGGKILVEPKENVIKRIGRSPDCADAVVMAWYAGTSGWSLADMEAFASNKVDKSRLPGDLVLAAQASGVDTSDWKV